MEREVTAEYEPTAEQRALVESASAFGITQAEIANQLGIDEKTLRLSFPPLARASFIGNARLERPPKRLLVCRTGSFVERG